VKFNVDPWDPTYGSSVESELGQSAIEAEIAIGTPPAGKSVGSLRLPSGALVGGIIRKGKLMHADDETKLEVGDRVMVFSPTASESEVRKALMG